MSDISDYLAAQGAPQAAAPQVTESRPINEADFALVKDRLKKLFPNMGAGVEDLRNQAKDITAAPTQLDVSPILALADNISGGQTNFAKGHQAPETLMDRQIAAAKLNEMANGQDVKEAGAVGDFLKSQLQTKVRTLTPKEANYGQINQAGAAKLAKAFGDDLDPNKARGGNLAKSQATINSADKVDALFQQFPDYNVPTTSTSELSSAVAGLISNGSPQSQHQINDLTPQSLRGDANKLAGWLTNDPKGLGQQKFMHLLHDTALRERQVATDQVRKAQIQRLDTHAQFKKLSPEGYNAIRNSYGLTDDVIDSYKNPKTQSLASGTGGEIKVSNGKETLSISPSDLVHAQAEGYSVVK